MNPFFMLRPLLLWLPLFLTACAGQFVSKVDFDPNEPIRVAILPFYQTEDGKILEQEFDTELVVDHVPLVFSKLKESPSTVVQRLVQEKLGESSLDIVAPGFVQAQLGHHAFVIDRKYAFNRILKTPASRLCELLFCDAVLFGEVTRWTRSYYGIQSVNTIGLQLKLVRAADNKVIFQVDAEDSKRRGITGVPTGFSSIALEPILGLDNDEIVKLGDELVTESLKPLFVKEKPDFTKVPAPAIFGATHNKRPLRKDSDEAVAVLVLGTPGMEGFFQVGTAGRKVPLFEVDEGHYSGFFTPVGMEPFLLLDQTERKIPITVTLRDQFGRVSTQQLPALDVP